MKMVLSLLIPISVFCQSWTGQKSSYLFQDDEIVLNAPNEGSYEIIQFQQAEFPQVISFKLNLNFNPSNNNYVQFGWENEDGFTQGFQIGENGSDDGLIWMEQNESVLNGCFSSSPELFFKVLFYETNCIIDVTAGDCSFDTIISFSNSRQLKFFFNSKITNSNIQGVRISNFKMGHYIPDTVAPILLQTDTFLYNHKLDFKFDESIEKYEVLEIGSDYFIRQSSENVISITSGTFNQGDSLLLYVEDLEGNDLVYELSLHIPELNFHDLIISEVLLDPEPKLDPSSCEFIELYNRTKRDFNFQEFELKVDDKLFSIPLNISANEMVVLSDTIYSIPTLSNSGVGMQIFIGDKLIDTWSPRPIAGSFKSEGGWSLERMLSETCVSDQTIWSEGQYGHSAGDVWFWEVTSVPHIKFTGVHTSADLNQYYITTEPNLLSISNLNIYANGEELFLDKEGRIGLSIPEELLKMEFTIEGMNCSASFLKKKELNLGPIQNTTNLSFSINELMTKSEDKDYLEFEVQGKGCVLSDSLILGIISENGILRTYRAEGKVICSGDYPVFTSFDFDSANHICVLPTSGSFDIPNDYALVNLMNTRGKILAEFVFNKDFHQEAYLDHENLSLGMYNGKWQSYEAMGSPTYPNHGIDDADELHVEVNEIVHFNFGNDDKFKVNIRHVGEREITLKILDRNGTLLYEWMNHAPFYNELNVEWDGKLMNNSIIQPGIYLLHIESIDEDGGNIRELKVFSVN
jgi:hypothetical protein